MMCNVPRAAYHNLSIEIFTAKDWYVLTKATWRKLFLETWRLLSNQTHKDYSQKLIFPLSAIPPLRQKHLEIPLDYSILAPKLQIPKGQFHVTAAMMPQNKCCLMLQEFWAHGAHGRRRSCQPFDTNLAWSSCLGTRTAQAESLNHQKRSPKFHSMLISIIYVNLINEEIHEQTHE